ncbi:GNAT family N-acetyltransferase [Bhargavaea cecembensis]|uniref:GNAT family N-acetyltransferase n=1 Tax=Bhargavaea cecembensis TaxID=394098 RepID=UPI00058FAA30|nr:GNAT family protein [Bhargavaea cecembensis]
MTSEFPVIFTERLILREATNEDAADMVHYLSDIRVVKHMGLAPFENTADALDEIAWYRSINAEGTGIRWAITLKDSGKMIGSCGFLNREPKHFRAEIGYELSHDYWGQGIAAEALRAVVQYGFSRLNLERIEALIEPANLPSIKLVERNGFLREGLLRHYEYTQGEFDDLYMYSLLKGDCT